MYGRNGTVVGLLVSLLIIFLSMIAKNSESATPGAKVSISLQGLNYGANVAVDVLSKAIQDIHLPDVKGNTDFAGGQVEYEVTNIKVTEFRKPATGVTMRPGQGLTWSVSGLYAKVTGDWSYKSKIMFVKVRDHGTFTATGSSISGAVFVTLGRNSTSGGVTISSTDCSINIPRLSIDVSGGASWLYNFFLQIVEDNIRDGLERAIRREARRAIDVNAARALITLPVTSPVVGLYDYIIDYQLTSNPSFTYSFLQTFHKAEFFHINSRAEAPFQANVLSDLPQADKMVYMWLSDYILNTAGYVLYKRNVLRYTLTQQDLPPSSRAYLATTCSFVCLGAMVPAVGKRYPNATIELEMSVKVAPTVSITPQGVAVQMKGSMIFRARLTDASLVYLFSAAAIVDVSVVPRIDGSYIKGKVERLSPQINVTDSVVGKISSEALTAAFKIVSGFIIPQLNNEAARGFPVLVIDHVQLINPSLILYDHSVCLAADVKYTP